MPPSSAQKSGGPSGSGAGISARRPRIRPPRRCAAASSGGKVAAADMSSTEPAWIPPMRGSTNRSTTRWPSLRDTSGPMARSPIGPRTSGRGSSASRARPSEPRTPTMPERAVGQNRVGIPRARPSGSGRRRPRAHTDAPRAATGSSASPSPTSRHRSTASGRRPRKPSGPRSTTRPPTSTLCSGPPSRAEASSTVTAGAPGRGVAPPVSSQAAVRPLMPPPTTTTRSMSACPVGRNDHIGQRGDERGVVVQRCRAPVAEAE